MQRKDVYTEQGDAVPLPEREVSSQSSLSLFYPAGGSRKVPEELLCSNCKVMPPILSAILCLQEMAVKIVLKTLYPSVPILLVPHAIQQVLQVLLSIQVLQEGVLLVPG